MAALAVFGIGIECQPRLALPDGHQSEIQASSEFGNVFRCHSRVDFPCACYGGNRLPRCYSGPNPIVIQVKSVEKVIGIGLEEQH